MDPLFATTGVGYQNGELCFVLFKNVLYINDIRLLSNCCSDFL